MALTAGARLGHYDVSALIGEGGMGQVWQATDTQLNRQVALKILPDAFADDPDRLARFQREAQILASLNHPNIAAIHGIEEAEGTRALVLELVEGPTLADRIAQGPIPVDEALPIAKQIAEALEAAHEAGVIHRDLKPANIKVREDGVVKVLDFGLAKAFQPDAGDASASMSPTISLTAAATQMGMVIGTAAYMAPEQAKGLPVDKRADIWAFGAVLFEMFTGKKLFDTGDVSEMLASVLVKDPDISSIGHDVPAHIRSGVRQCLVKDPTERVRDIGDVRLAMKGAFETTVSAPVEPVVTPSLLVWQRPAAIAVTVLAALVGGGLAVWVLTRPVPPAPRPLVQFVVQTPPDGRVRTLTNSTEVAISPDGTRIVYASWQDASGTRRLYVRQLGELDATPLRGGEGADAPFFSPDGQSVGFRAADGALKQVSVLGGPAVTIVVPDSPRGVTWGPDDTIVFGSPSGLMRVPAVGGDPEPLTTVDPDQEETDHRYPDVLPNGSGVLSTAWSGSDEGSRLAVLSLETGAVSFLLTGGSHPRYSPTGHIVYGVGGTLRAVGFDADQLELTTDPVPVVENVNTRLNGAANFALAANGSLIYVSGAGVGAGAGVGGQRALVWVDREGNEEPLETPLQAYGSPSVSPDGRRVTFDVYGPEGADIWVHHLERGTETQLTTDPATDGDPLWSPDGARVVFTSEREGQNALFRTLADSPGNAERIGTRTGSGTGYLQATSWADEGQTLLFWEVGGTSTDIGLVSMEGDGAAELLLDTAASEVTPDISPNGNWIAYESDPSGASEVYVQRFPALGDIQTISTDGGRQPLWSPDGGDLFYRGPRGMMVVEVLETEPTLRLGDPEVLFDTQYSYGRANRTYDVHPDGQRFLMVKDAPPTDDSVVSAQPQIILIENWFEELKRLVPID